MHFLVITWKIFGSLNSLAQVLKIMAWEEAGHQTVILVVHDRQGELLPCSFSGYGLQLHPDKKMKIKDTDYFYSKDVSCTVILASWLLCKSMAISPFGRFQAMQAFDEQWIDCFWVFYLICLQGILMIFAWFFVGFGWLVLLMCTGVCIVGLLLFFYFFFLLFLALGYYSIALYYVGG